MAWTDTKTDGVSTLPASEYNTMASYIQGKNIAVTVSNSATGDGLGDYICDGTADNVQIQSAIDYCITNGRPLWIKKGTYDIQATLTVNGNLMIFGDGPEHTSLVSKNSLNDYIITINSTQGGTTHYRTVFRDFKLSGNASNQTSGGCIVSYGGIEGIYQNIHCEYFYNYGIFLWGSTGNSGEYGHHNRILTCLFDNGEGSGGEGIGLYLKANDENEISQCEFQYNKFGAKDECGFNRFVGCSFVDGQVGLYILDCSRTGVGNCVFDKCAYEGLRLKGAFNNVTGCSFYDCSDGNTNTYSALKIDYYGCNNITGNMFGSDTSGQCKAGIEEVGSQAGADSTKGNNLITGNNFISMAGATVLAASVWGTSTMIEANTNLKSNNYSITTSGATSL